MSLDFEIESLARQPLFVDFSLEQLRLVAFGSQKLRYNAGTELFQDKQSSDGAFLIMSGKVQVEIPGTTKSQVREFSPGDLLGEMALLVPNNRVGRAVVTENAEVLKISRFTMRRVLEEFPELAALIHDRIASSVVSFTNKLSSVEQKLTEN